MGILDDAAKVVAKFESTKNAGAKTVQIAMSSSLDPTNDAELISCVANFSNKYPEWVADDGLEEANRVKYYPGTKMAYIYIAQINRYSHYTPDVATNNYCPFPEPNSEGIYPYVYGMLVWPGMKVQYDGTNYVCILPSGTHKLVHTPAEAVSVFEKE